MYKRAYGIIETLAPLHVGASAGEETGNLNLIFRDQFTQTGIIPGSSIRGRFRADMRSAKQGSEHDWYGKAIDLEKNDSETTEAYVKFEYASLVWLPVFCPGQPIVWVTCPWLLRRYQLITGIAAQLPAPYTASANLQGRQVDGSDRKILFFNLGFLEVKPVSGLDQWVPDGVPIKSENLVVVDDNDIAMIHDMALYRQSRVKLSDAEKKVDGGAFFNVEALPEGSVMVFPIALRRTGWQPFDRADSELYFGGLESIGFGRCRVTLAGEY
jgi:CRISPR-associated protein Cmr4